MAGKLTRIEKYRRALEEAKRKAERVYDAAFHANCAARLLAEAAQDAGLSGEERKAFLALETAKAHDRGMSLERAAWTHWRELVELAELTGAPTTKGDDR